MTATATAGAAGQERKEPAATRSPWIPCLAAWLLPGAGHLLLGRVAQGVVFAAVVVASFAMGVSLEGTVYASDPEAPLSRLATLANLGAGPLDVWARMETDGGLTYTIPDSRVDAKGREQTLRRLREKVASQTHAYGRTFLLTAGLMNLLLVLDVFDHCIGRKGSAARRRDPAPEAAGGTETA